MLASVNWSSGLYCVVRDNIFERIGHVPARFSPPGQFLSGLHLGLCYPCNGGRSYVAYHRNFFDPATYARLAETGVAWLRLDEIRRFNREVLPRIDRPFVLVTAESDRTAPSDFAAECDHLVASGLVRRWFAINYDHSAHPGFVSPLPLGLNYSFKHTFERIDGPPPQRFFCDAAPPATVQDAHWESVVAAMGRPSERAQLAFADFWHNNSSLNRRYGESRDDIRAHLQSNPCVVFPRWRVPRPDLPAAYSHHAFVISPHGRGLDCFRTWEALLCGCIVIVKRSPIDPLYAGLPVVILDDWREITPANLQLWLAHFGDGFDRTWLRKVLSLEHWRGEIDRAAESC